MELKMRAAGASTTLIEDAQELRANLEVQRQLLLAGGENPSPPRRSHRR
jgi:hypothetical protein